MKVTNININILKEILQRIPEKDLQLKKKFPKYEKWLEGEDYPTYNQLVELSEIFNIPFGYFFLEKLPERKYPIPHYRTNQNGDFNPSSELLDTILFAQKIQEWAKNILLEWGQEKLPFCGKYKDNINDILKNIPIEVNEVYVNTDAILDRSFNVIDSLFKNLMLNN